MRQALLKQDPGIGAVSLHMLVGIASAIEHEAVRRYAQLAQLMERRGEIATAVAFRVMLEEERGHIDAVERWAGAMGEPVPPSAQYEWTLPPDLSSSWDEVAGSALLTPYRAFAIAVDNEERAFAFYAYLAAHADDARVMAEAEKLAAEELRHAALMRRWRRQAYHRDRRAAQQPRPVVATPAALHELVARHEAVIAACHRDLAGRLRRLGDEQSARLLEQFLQAPAPSGMQVPAASDVQARPSANGQDACPVDDAGGQDDPVHLLVAAQKPLEALSETLEAVLRFAEGALFAEAEQAITSVVTRLARIALQAGHRMQALSR